MESLRMLPRFDSRAIELEKISQSNSIHRYNSVQFLERAYDRSGKKCWPAVNTNIGKFDLEYTYEIVGSTLESYIRYRKLNRCKALSNFIEYRNKVYKREKIAQYALSEPKIPMKEMHPQQMINIPTKIIRIEENPTPTDSLSSLMTSETGPPTPIPSSQFIVSETSQKLSPSTPIPSPKFMSPKTSQELSPSTPILSSQSMISETSKKLSLPTPVLSSKSLTPKTSKKLSPSTPIPSPKSLTPKTSQKLPTPIGTSKSLTSKTSQKLSPSIPIRSPKSMSPKTSQKLSPSTAVSSSKSLTPKTSQNLSPSPRFMSPNPSGKLSPSTTVSSSKSMSPTASQKLSPSFPIPSSRSLSPKPSPSNTKEAIIPIPSVDLLRSHTSKQSKMSVSKKTSGNIKQISSPSIKGSSPVKSKMTSKTKPIPKKPLSKSHKTKHKTTCNIL